jgi:acyl-CoA thioester hydrolase
MRNAIGEVTGHLPEITCKEDGMEENPSAAGHHQSVDVYFDDLDAFGMVHNAKYAVLHERAWQRFWMEYGHDIRSPDGRQITRVLTVDYYLPICAPDRVTVVLWVNRVGRTSADCGFAVRSADGQVLHAEGRRVIIRIDPVTHRPAPWTDAGRRILLGLTCPADARSEEGPAAA